MHYNAQLLFWDTVCCSVIPFPVIMPLIFPPCVLFLPQFLLTELNYTDFQSAIILLKIILNSDPELYSACNPSNLATYLFCFHHYWKQWTYIQNWTRQEDMSWHLHLKKNYLQVSFKCNFSTSCTKSHKNYF